MMEYFNNEKIIIGGDGGMISSFTIDGKESRDYGGKDEYFGGDDYYGEDIYSGIDGGTTITVKDPILSNPIFVYGLTGGILAFSIACGIVLAKLRIKKGIDLYED